VVTNKVVVGDINSPIFFLEFFTTIENFNRIYCNFLYFLGLIWFGDIKMSERTEALMRIVVGIVTGFILGIWKMAVQIVAILNLLIALFTNQRNKDLAEFCEIWNTQMYIFLRYMTFVTNKRPFPFNSLEKNLSKFGK